MKLDLTQENVIAWLGQFEGGDESVATRLLEHLEVITADQFRDGLSDLISSRANAAPGPVALYAERKVGHRHGVAHRLFKENKRPKKSVGSGPAPVKSRHAGRHETGSEGLVANIITQSSRQNIQNIIDHPGPDSIRKNKIRRFILVTDFIGTGMQSNLYLDAAWKMASVKSWKSGGFIEFEVICFAATAIGKAKIENHPCQPEVHQVMAAPTLSDFDAYDFDEVYSLIERNGPPGSSTKVPRLGYGNIGALISFAHGMPNNAPRFLHKSSRYWKALFPGRVTSGTSRVKNEDRAEKVANTLARLREEKLIQWASGGDKTAQQEITVLVLSALKRSPKTAQAVSARTGISISEVEATIARARAHGWLAKNNQLTAVAYTQFNALKNPREKSATRYKPQTTAYFPTELRAPVRRFS